MKKCFALAKKGEGKVSPNPLVGAVLADDNGKILSTGFHKKYGGSHAERVCLEAFSGNTKGKTLIVSLEPCNHHGKTPPCTDLIIKSGIKKLVIAMKDPNESVKGGGIAACKKAGIEVIDGVLADEAKKLNEIFIKNQAKKLPFVAIKSATTIDGRIAVENGESEWITNEKSRKFVQALRTKYHAVLTSAKTVLADNPRLTSREKHGVSPIRVIVDKDLQTTPDLNVYNDDGVKIYVAIGKKVSITLQKAFPLYVEFIQCPQTQEGLDLEFLLKKLYEKGVTSLMIEAGGGLCGAFLKQNLVDKLYHFTAPKIIGDCAAISCISGLDTKSMAKTKKLKLEAIKRFNDDILAVYYFD